jgi:cobalt/nickel transport system permease protein
MHHREPLDCIAWTNRWTHRHPAEKILLALGLLALVMLLPAWPFSLLMVVVNSLLALGLAKIPHRPWIKLLAAQAAFLIVASAITAAQLGWEAAMHTVLRSLGATSCLLLLALTTPLPRVFSWLYQWPSLRPLANLASDIYQFLALGIKSTQQGRTAMRRRLGPPQMRTHWPLIGQSGGRVLTRLLQRSLTMKRGYESRGVDAVVPLLEDHAAFDRRFAWSAVCLLATLACAGARSW